MNHVRTGIDNKATENTMEEFLKQLKGKTVDVAFGSTANARGEIVEVKDGILQLLDEEKRIIYVAVKRIAVVRESDDNHSRPGFLA